MIKNGYYYPDWVWKNKPHEVENEKGTFEGGCAFCMVVGNRRAGKSVGVGIFCIADYLVWGYRTALIRRFDKDFQNSKAPAMPNFWKKCWDYRSEFVEIVKGDKKLQKLYPLDKLNGVDWEGHTLEIHDTHAYIDNEVFCYPVMLNRFDQNKNNVYENVHNIIYDEFIPETSKSGLPGEFRAVANVYDTIARSRNNALNTTGIIMMANSVSGANEFYSEFRVDKELRSDTKRLLRPENGWLLEVVNNTIAGDEVRNSPFGRALMCSDAGRAYLDYSQNNKGYDDSEFVEKLHGENKYVCSILFDGKIYCIRNNIETGLYVFSNEGVDQGFKKCYALRKEDHSNGSKMVSTKGRMILHYYKVAYEQGLMRFDNVISKKVFLAIYPLL